MKLDSFIAGEPVSQLSVLTESGRNGWVRKDRVESCVGKGLMFLVYIHYVTTQIASTLNREGNGSFDSQREFVSRKYKPLILVAEGTR